MALKSIYNRMRYTNILDDILGNRQQIRIIRFLLKSEVPVNGRQLAFALGIHHKTCHHSLKSLAANGIVKPNKNGKAIIYTLNNDNYLVKNILRHIFTVESRIIDSIISTLKRKTHIPFESVILFGSVAKGSERPASDVDLLIVVANKSMVRMLSKRIEEISYDFILEYGNMLSPIIISMPELSKRLRQKNVFLQQIFYKGRSIYGKSIQRLIYLCQRKK